MNHEMTQWKCFAQDTLSFYDHIWSCVELFSRIEHKIAQASTQLPWRHDPKKS